MPDDFPHDVHTLLTSALYKIPSPRALEEDWTFQDAIDALDRIKAERKANEKLHG